MLQFTCVKKQKDSSGFTIVESMVAVLILAIFVSGACGMIATAREIMDRARSHYTASNIAKNRLEHLQTYDFDQVPLLAEDSVTVNKMGHPSGNGHFQRTTSVSNVAERLYNVTVTVEIRNRLTWDFSGGGLERVQTYITEFIPPPGQ